MSDFKASVTVVPRRKLAIGLNYKWAWNKYGDYFGSNDPLLKTWTSVLRTNLRVFRDRLGVRHVRIFLLCNLNNFGGLTHLGGDRYTVTLPSGPEGLIVRDRYVSEFREMLNVFKQEEMLVIPSFVDFGAALVALKHHGGGHGGAGARLELWTNTKKREEFFDIMLEPLLMVGAAFKETIFAFEVMNEPIWAASPFSTFTSQALTTSEMNVFLKDALRRIQAHGLKSTVGHRFFKDLSELETGDVRQFHYYPPGTFKPGAAPLTESEIPTFDDSGKAFLGEFSVADPKREAFKDGFWPDVDRDVQQPDIVPDPLIRPRNAQLTKTRARARSHDCGGSS